MADKPLSIRVSDSLGIEEGMIRLRFKEQGKKASEITSKPDFFQEAKERRRIDMVIDHENDRYQKIVKGPDGKIVYQKEEPLSQHTGRGWPKRKKEEGNANYVMRKKTL